MPEQYLMEEDAPYSPPRDDDATREEEIFPHYVRPWRVDVQEVRLSKKSHTTLVTPMIPNGVPLLMDTV